MSATRIALMYHDIVTKDDKSSGFQNESAFQYKVLDTAFEEQVKALEGKDVEFTFDDGGVSFLTTAASILEKYGRRGVFFIITKFIGTPGFLSAEQVKELAARGHQVGSHSHSHPEDMTRLGEEEIKQEWTTSTSLLKNLVGEQVLASIPNGFRSKTVVRYAQECGIKCLYSSDPSDKEQTENGMALRGRYVVHEGMCAQEVYNIVCKKSVRRKLAIRWSMLGIAKFILGPSYNTIKLKLLKH